MTGFRNVNWKEYETEQLWPTLSYYPGKCLEGLITNKKSQSKQPVFQAGFKLGDHLNTKQIYLPRCQLTMAPRILGRINLKLFPL